MNTLKISNKVLVSTPWEKNKHLPLGFPFLTFKGKDGVSLILQGDVNDVHNLQKELEEVKQIVNRELNKVGVRLRDTHIDIQFLQPNKFEDK